MAIMLLLAAVGIQLLAGAFHSERGLYSDEAAHFMNGLLIRDYVREALGTSPLAFAREYYQAYPKIAPLMWPPLFHAVLGLALLPGWPPMTVAILLLGGCMAWIAWRLYFVALESTSTPAAVGVTALFLVTPAVVRLGSSVMVDIVIAAFAMEAAWWLGRYFETTKVRHAALFGVMTACACLVKGNGISVVLAPGVLLIITGRWDILRRSGLYLAAAIVVVFAVPFLALAYRLDGALGDFGPLTWPLVLERLRFYSSQIWMQLGTWPLVLAAIGSLVVLSRPSWLSLRAYLQTASLLAVVLGTFAFHVLSPHLLSDERYITLALAPMLGLTAQGVMTACRPVPSPVVRRTAQLSLFLLMATLHVRHSLPAAQRPLGYRAVASVLADQPLEGRRLLIVSDEQGEGACVAEIAVLNRHPRPMVIRGSKLLASDDWMGRNVVVHYSSPEAILADLEAMHVEFIVLDEASEARALPYWGLVDAVASRFPDRVVRVFSRAVDERRGPIRPLSVYRLTTLPEGAPKPVPASALTLAIQLGTLDR
jgi:hypothetical protein